MVDALVALAVLFARAPLFEVHVFRGHAEGFGHRGAHHRQPLGRRLLAGVFADDQVPGIPVDHRPNFRDLPVVESEHLDILTREMPAQVLEALFDPVGQHFGLFAVCCFQLIN